MNGGDGTAGNVRKTGEGMQNTEMKPWRGIRFIVKDFHEFDRRRHILGSRWFMRHISQSSGSAGQLLVCKSGSDVWSMKERKFSPL